MINTLTEKLQRSINQDLWQSDDSNNVNLLISPKKDIIIEWIDTGYFEIQKNKILFNDCTIGHTYSLRKNGTLEEWSKFQHWHLEGEISGSFRTDIPRRREEVEINGEIWDYNHWKRPSHSIGAVVSQHFADPKLLPMFLNEIIDPYYEAVAGFIRIAKRYQLRLFPHLAILHGLKDEQGYYFIKCFDRWDQTLERSIEMNIETGQILIHRFQSVLPKDFGQQWYETASQKWKSLL
jgi:hypothetical protein